MYNDPQQPQQQPQQLPPRKKRGPFFWIVLIGGIIIAFGLCRSIIQASSTATPVTQATATTQPVQPTDTPVPTATQGSPAPTDTPVPTPAPLKWTTTHTYTGNGSKTTGTFSVPDTWTITWTCDAANNYGVDGALSVAIYDSQNNPIDDLLETCKSGITSKGVSEEHQGGDVYLKIDGSIPWTVQVQELK
jgi:hypothetical protein